MDDVLRIDFTELVGEHFVDRLTVLFNKNVISENEVKALIENGGYDQDNRIVVTKPERADALNGIKKE